MFQRKTRRFRHHQNERSNFSRGNGNTQARLRSNSFSSGQARNKFRPPLSAEKLLEKYSTLAKEAMSSGDKTLSENYLQHADHFARVIEDKNKNRIQSNNNTTLKPTLDKKDSPTSIEDKKDSPTSIEDNKN